MSAKVVDIKQVLEDVDRGLEIKSEMAAPEAELEKIEARLKEAGLHGEQVELKDADREGRQFRAEGTSRIVPVIFTADKIRASFTMYGEVHHAIANAADGKLSEFYRPVHAYQGKFESGKKFRAHAAEMLGAKAPAFVSACVARDKDGIPKSDIKIMWDEAEPA